MTNPPSPKPRLLGPPPKRWILPPDPAETPDAQGPPELAQWAEQLDISPFLAGLLHRRGISTLADMDEYLSPGLKHLAHPHTVPGLEQGAEALARGLTQGKTLAVWGDYDVDGVCGTALVLEVLQARGFAASHYLPARAEGYGLSIPGIEKLADQGVNLLLTVDCGITDVAPIARARELGMEVVVSDHHLPLDELPQALALVNPRLGECPCPHLAGVGVAFLLMAAVNKLLPGQPTDIRQVLDLVALGTLADVVRITGQNRILVKNGLLLLSEGKRPGVAALKQAMGLSPAAEVTAGKVGFGLGPRINAAGRLAHAEDALQLLLAPDSETARPLAQRLEDLNSRRKAQEEEITAQALEQAAPLRGAPAHLAAGEDWNTGVIGIVASRLVEEFHRPVFVLGKDGELWKGSGRSIPEVDLHQVLVECGHLFANFGGHKQAGGFSITPEKLNELRQAFPAAVAAQLDTLDEPPRPALKLDALLSLADVNLRLIKEVALMQPFGPGNPEPVFACTKAVVDDRRTFGKNHVNLAVRQDGVCLPVKAWRQASRITRDVCGALVQLAFCPKLNTFGGVQSLELHLKDLQVLARPVVR